MRTRLIVGLASSLVLSTGAWAQQDFSEVEIQTVDVADGLYMLVGQGGNIGLSLGDDGAFIVDTQFAPLSEKIQAAVNAAGGGDVAFVVNTHWHGDHTGGNQNFRGGGATIMAHDNVKARMSTDQVRELPSQDIPASPPDALPNITYPGRMTFHYNGNTVNLIHVENAHTDGDTLVHFTNLNVFHMGDTFFHNLFPFVDVSSNGSIDGIIAAAEEVLSRSDGGTMIIPGHGPLATPDDLRDDLEVLRTVRDRIRSMIDQGMSEDAVFAANPTEEWNDSYGAGFMNPETFTRLVYRSLSR